MNTAVLVLFAFTTFAASALLFAAEPMIGRMVLPLYGGTPAVWITCLLYFQCVLLGGYLLVQNGRRQGALVSWGYLVLVGLLLVVGYGTLPFAPRPRPGSTLANPGVQLFMILAGTVSIPLLICAATAPLVQAWFSRTGHPRADDPYFLYAASNAGSLAALVAYPFVIEPNLSLSLQADCWEAAYIVLAAALVACAVVARRSRPGRLALDFREPAPADESPAGRPRARTIVFWLFPVFAASTWMMGVTTYVTTDLAPMPLLWVIPLALYLLSYILGFAGPTSRAVWFSRRVLPFAVLATALVLTAGFPHLLWLPLHLATFFVGAVACHASLAQARPPTRHLATFYLTIACGGLLGGVSSAVIAPVLFTRLVEYPLAIVLGCLAGGLDSGGWHARRYGLAGDLVIPAVIFVATALLVTDQGGLSGSPLGVPIVMAASGLGLLVTVYAQRRPLRFAFSAAALLAAGGLTQGVNGRLLHAERDFFGMTRVTEDARRNVHRLFHGSTLHGQQSLDPAASREPSTYFTRSGPIGRMFQAIAPRLDQPGDEVAIVGLGAGTLAAYARPEERWTFYEIDPAIERIARDPRYFTFLKDTRAGSLDVVIGDARLRLAGAPDHAYRLIVLDAFSSDSLPVHLITREAIRLYRSRLAGGGLLAFNLSNRYLDLEPLIGRQARDAGMVCRIAYDLEVTPDERRSGKQPSIWAVMAENEAALGPIATDPYWRQPVVRPDARAWTDDYSDLARYLRWLPRPTRGPS